MRAILSHNADVGRRLGNCVFLRSARSRIYKGIELDPHLLMLRTDSLKSTGLNLVLTNLSYIDFNGYNLSITKSGPVP